MIYHAAKLMQKKNLRNATQIIFSIDFAGRFNFRTKQLTYLLHFPDKHKAPPI